MSSREAVYTVFMIVFCTCITRLGDELATYRMRGTNTNHLANPTYRRECNYSTVEPLMWGHRFKSEMWPFKRGGLSSGVEINTFMFRFTLSSGLSRGFGLSSGVPFYLSNLNYLENISKYTHWYKIYVL